MVERMVSTMLVLWRDLKYLQRRAPFFLWMIPFDCSVKCFMRSLWHKFHAERVFLWSRTIFSSSRISYDGFCLYWSIHETSQYMVVHGLTNIKTKCLPIGRKLLFVESSSQATNSINMSGMKLGGLYIIWYTLLLCIWMMLTGDVASCPYWSGTHISFSWYCKVHWQNVNLYPNKHRWLVYSFAEFTCCWCGHADQLLANIV